MGLDRALFEGQVGDEFLCGLCNMVLLNPVTAGCSHAFCQRCVNKKHIARPMQTKSVCPFCSARLTKDSSQTPIEFKLKLLDLTVKCSHKCGEKFTLGELPDHDDVCPNTPVICRFHDKGCKRTVRRCDLDKHLDECDFRLVHCDACGYGTIYCELFTHQSRVRCLANKLKQQVIREQRLSRKEIQNHRDVIFCDKTRLDHQQRKRVADHSRNLKTRRQLRTRSKQDDCSESEGEFSPQEGVFMTEHVTGYQDPPTDDDRASDATSLHKSRIGRTPHSSRSGFVQQQCGQCNKLFRPDRNHPDSCRWHPGPTCYSCGRLDYQTGCTTGCHMVWSQDDMS